MSSSHLLTEGSIRATLLRFTLPFVAASLLQFLYGAADLIIVGQFADAAQMTAVNTGCQVMQAVTSLILGLSTGGTILIGQYTGARMEHEVSRTIGTMFTFFTLLALLLTGVLTLSANGLVALMGVPAAAVGPARQYLFICACGTFFITGYNVVSGMLRGLGDSKRPMLFIAVACVINVGADLVLVGVLGMGAAGAAIATVAAQGVSLLLSIGVLNKRDFPFEFRRANFRFWPGKTRRVLKLGGPVALQNVLVSVSFLLITASVNPLGLGQSAAVGVAERIITFCMTVPIAFSSSIAAMTAQNIGAGKPDRAKEALRWGLIYSLALGAVVLLLIQLAPAAAARLFTPDPDVVYHSVLYLRTYSIDCLLVCFVFCLNGFFSGCGRTLFTMSNSLCATFLVRVPMVIALSGMPGVTMFHIGLASPAASLLQVLIQLLYLKLGRWRTGAVLVEDAPA